MDFLYALARPLLFLLPAEVAHRVSLLGLQWWSRLVPRYYLRRRLQPCVQEPIEVMGCVFNNRVGLAAGLDKDGRYLAGLLTLGFGFVEVGTVTLRAQKGNTPPRLMRKVSEESLFNRMGFNNEGVSRLCERLNTSDVQRLLRVSNTRLGISIGINSDTAKERAVTELCEVFERVYVFADYVAVNFSSPNTEGLRDYQNSADLTIILRALSRTRTRLEHLKTRRVSLVIKLSPDLSEDALLALVPVLGECADGVIFSNTVAHCESVGRFGRKGRGALLAGGLSGRLLQSQLPEKTAMLARALRPLPLIACGGIDSGAVAVERLASGAQLIQLYTGLIYKGPGLVRNIARYLRSAHY